MQKRELYLDAVRGIACLIVLFAHILSSLSIVGARVSGCGKIGVWLFFVMSGFWMMYPQLQDDKIYTNYIYI